MLGIFVGASQAAVSPVGDVLPADDPFTPLIYTGLPLAGNVIDETEPVDRANEVGRHDVDIIVGQKSFGRLDIDGNSVLNFQDLIIGDQGLVGSQMRKGTGFVLITGIGAKYNNDPNILPPGVPINFGSTADFARLKTEGFDMYVGRNGNGTLEILAGGRAEIQDLTIVGDQIGCNRFDSGRRIRVFSADGRVRGKRRPDRRDASNDDWSLGRRHDDDQQRWNGAHPGHFGDRRQRYRRDGRRDRRQCLRHRRA